MSVTVARQAPAPVPVAAPPKIGRFQGDADDLLDKLVAACKVENMRGSNPGAFGRELLPYFEASDVVPSPDQCGSSTSTRASAPSSRKPRTAKHSRSPRSNSPASKHPRAAPKNHGSSSGASTPERAPRPAALSTFSTGYISPKPESLPIPSFLC